MTTIPVENNPPIVTIVATAGQTVFTFGFLIQTAAQLQVIRTPIADPDNPVTLALNTDYTVPVSAIDTNSGGDITLTAGSFPTGAAAGDLFTLSREIPIIRQSAFPFRGSLSSETLNFQLNTVFLVLQEQERDIKRAMTLNIADALSSIEIPLNRANQFLGFDGSEVPIAALPAGGGVPISTFMQSFVTQTTALAGLDYLEGIPQLSSSVDNRVIKMDGTSGDRIQQTGITVDDSDRPSGYGTLIEEVSGTTKTLTAADLGKTFRLTNAGSVTITCPEVATEDLIDGFIATFIDAGPTDVTFAVEGSDNLRHPFNATGSAGRGSVMSVVKDEDGEWILTGNVL